MRKVRTGTERGVRGMSGERTDSLTSTTSSSSTTGLESVFQQVSPIGVRGSRVMISFSVIVRSLILVSDEETDWCTESNTSFDTGLEEDLIGFVTLRRTRDQSLSNFGSETRIVTYGSREVALAGTTTSHLRLNIVV